MSTLLTAHALHVETAFGPLFNTLSFTLKKGDRIGLIGHNGCGKSTLLQVLDGTLARPPRAASHSAGLCLMARVEQHLPEALRSQSLLQAVLAPLPADVREAQRWLAERLLAQMGFYPAVMEQQTTTLSGGQHTRLLLARALIRQPDLLLLDEPGNHLDLPTLLWLESFLQTWQGSFVLVSHDNTLLDAVTNASWILRDQTLHSFALPCSAARQALQEQDESAALRHKAGAKGDRPGQRQRPAVGHLGRVYDNEDLARKAKQMEKQVAPPGKTSKPSSASARRGVCHCRGTPCRPTACWRWTPCPSRPRRACHPSSPPAWRACAAAIAWPSWGATAAVNRPCCACCGSR